MNKPASGFLVVMAMKEESHGLLEEAGADVIYTGLGKVNAAYALASAIYRRRAEGSAPQHILNLGTAGSHSFAARALVECTRFAQHDMDVSAIGIPPGVTPFETDVPAILAVNAYTRLPSATCHSGDRFVTERSADPKEVIDMEAYALAKVCLREGLRFTCVKYISDGADGQAASDWQQTLEHAAGALADFYRRVATLA